jgi:hypothetical protein
MRTTLTIDDDVYAVARHMAALRHIAVGAALSELARRGLNRLKDQSVDNEFPVFSVSEKAPVFGLDEVKSIEDEE